MVANKVNRVEVIVDNTCRSNNMADMEAPLAKDLPREAHPATKVIMELWDHLIAFLCGSYEDIQGETNSASGVREILKRN